MFTVLESPCILKQYQQPNRRQFVHPFAQPMACANELDFFQLLQQVASKQETVKAQPPRELRYSVTTTDANNHVISLYKEISDARYEEIMRGAVENIKDEILREHPQYRVATDFFGNTFYVKNTVSEHELQNEIIKRFDLNAFNKKIARKSFKGFTIEINDDSTEFVVYNESENVYQKFESPELTTLKNVSVSGFNVQKSDDQLKNFAVLNIAVSIAPQADFRVTDRAAAQAAQTALNNLIEWSIPQRREVQKQEQEEAAGREARIDAERRRQLELQKAKEEKLLKQREEEKRQERIRIAKLKEQRQKDLEAKIFQERRIQEAKLAEEKERIEKEHEKAMKELEEKQRQLELNKQKEMLDELFPKKITIDYNSDHENDKSASKDEQKKSKVQNSKRRSSSPPPLEEVEDEEVNRYRELLQRSPTNNTSIIEDALD
ncbi:hypothetical protein TPHA_0A05750 [Tetrapisispora phaffii CBS 4417]|uniref:Uncharacterized protein n=1 Tax=Tetrapisispora phaffii (strain ATCC 24235 / CBS 4417 / NBRC 1672 / NRRL Y-8282 / UCD 70-5) TaxID=1071381 RepID=G8BP21_TETPH|nr:hypothetical protein TPHA_0A05750 [Tetrapisispora phaffii CBS 4417]CCE61649.1 hypothetical protein TPHA_0A05750 [Tetrapisispora phaffii CBS 4417]